MQTPPVLLPDARTLHARLAAVLTAEEFPPMTVVDRKRPRYMSTFPNEIVTCRLGDGKARRLFCKYERGCNHNAHGHRGGLAYEAAVYRHVLQPLHTVRPEFVGAHTDGTTAETWLFLEYLDHCTRLKDIRVRRKGISQPVAMSLAARWLGKFHRSQQVRLGNVATAFLKRYDADYYAGWVQRAWAFARPVRRRFPWLAILCAHAHRMFAPLLAAPATIVHGEFYINNVLVRRKQVYPVDWESAAIGPGEIDLAALTEGPWAKAVVRRCERDYQRHRWPDTVPGRFAFTLDTARLYLHFRWLGERPDWTLGQKHRWRYACLREIGRRLGLI
ncbi:MAG: hypothetical protein KGS61_15785 [Verrucomicrobia bacterium]|nr:hypothetical protein [Verrucomicrobiota bacterium]